MICVRLLRCIYYYLLGYLYKIEVNNLYVDVLNFIYIVKLYRGIIFSLIFNLNFKIKVKLSKLFF